MDESQESSLVSRYLRATFGPASDGRGDEDLLDSYREQGDRRAFELLVWRHMRFVLRTSQTILQDKHLAEDVAQSVFFVLARKPPKLKQGSLAGWLHTVSLRIARKSLSKRYRQPMGSGDINRILDSQSEVTQGPEANFEDLAIIHEEIAKLPDKYRLPVILNYFQDCSYKDVADKLGWNVGTVSTQIARAKKLLHERLTRRGVVISNAVLLSTLGTEQAGSAFAGLIEKVVRSSFAFADGNYSAVSSMTALDLAKNHFRQILLVKCLFAGSTFSLILLTVGALSASGLRPSSPPDDPANVYTIAPVPAAPIPSTLPVKTIRKFENLGAIYGGLVLSKQEPKRGSKFRSFEAGEAAARRGIPCFQWKKLPDKAEELPNVDKEFAVDIIDPKPKSEWIQKISRAKNLKTLHIYDTMIQEKEFQYVKDMKELRELAIDVSNIGYESLVGMDEFENLEALYLCSRKPNATLGAAGAIIKPVSEGWLGFKRLKILHLRNILITDTPHQDLARIGALEVIDFAPDHINDSCIKAFVKYGSLRLLNRASAADGGLAESDAKISSLDFSDCEFDDSALNQLNKLSDLRSLDLTRARIGDAGLKSMATEMKNLSTLNLTDTSVTDEGLRVLEGTSIKTLVLKPAAIGNRTLGNLIDIKMLHILSCAGAAGGKLPKSVEEIESIDLRGTKVTADCTRSLVKLNNLRRILLDKNLAADEIRKTLPRCEIAKE